MSHRVLHFDDHLRRAGALRVTLFVDSSDSVIETSGRPCPESGRPEESWALHQRLRELSAPADENTLFTTKHAGSFGRFAAEPTRHLSAPSLGLTSFKGVRALL